MKIFILISFIVKTSTASYTPIKGKTPRELHHLITTLQKSPSYSLYEKEINSLIIQIDQTFSSLSEKDIDLIIRSEIFRTLLKFSPSDMRSLHTLSDKMLNDLYILSKKIRSPFFSWLALAIHKDLKLLFRSPLFPSFKKSIKLRHKKRDREIALMKKKFLLLLPWQNFLVTTSEEQLAESIYPLLLKCLRQIHFKSSLYSSLTPSYFSPQGKLQYFEKVLTTSEKNSIDSLLSPILKNSKPDDLPELNKGWIPEKDDHTQKLPLPTNDWLPEPVDDWIF